METSRVAVSAPDWALFLFELMQSQSDCEGLLFGQTVSRKIRVVTDQDSDGERVENVSTVQGFILISPKLTCFQQNSPYNLALDKALFRRMAESHGNGRDLLGWFQFRRGVRRHAPTCRLKKLSQILKTEAKTPLLALYLTHRETETANPLAFQMCWVQDDGRLNGVRLDVVNMGDTNDEVDYWPAEGNLGREGAGWIQEGLADSLERGITEAAKKATIELKNTAQSLIKAQNKFLKLKLQSKNLSGDEAEEENVAPPPTRKEKTIEEMEMELEKEIDAAEEKEQPIENGVVVAEGQMEDEEEGRGQKRPKDTSQSTSDESVNHGDQKRGNSKSRILKKKQKTKANNEEQQTNRQMTTRAQASRPSQATSTEGNNPKASERPKKPPPPAVRGSGKGRGSVATKYLEVVAKQTDSGKGVASKGRGRGILKQ